MLNLSAKINYINEAIKAIKVDIRACIVEARRQLGQGVKKASVRQVICIVCHNEKPESEMDEVNICNHCRGREG